MTVFTPDQVAKLEKFQRDDQYHPFTCKNNGRTDHRNGGVLVPTVRGWICPYCDYTQDWAHGSMTGEE